ncbi:class I SAM-dependent methyltransferase [Streptomyces sp. NPDC047081]|uniref:O-methyltransferase n=1 Tax=Streptomyces sp. NPDC047081 TaxID=3154706 RepID=UPI0033E95BDC
MATLTDPAFQLLLARLFSDAERTQREFHEERRALLAEGFQQGSPPYAAAARKAHLAITPETGELLYLLARLREARTIVEFGTSFGVSTLHLAAALRDNGGGRLIATETEPTKAEAARRTLAEAGVDDLVEILLGDARETLRAKRPRPVDLLFLDGPGHLYVDVLKLLEPDLSPTAVIVADNAEARGYRTYLETHDHYVSVSFGTRVEVTLLSD